MPKIMVPISDELHQRMLKKPADIPWAEKARHVWKRMCEGYEDGQRDALRDIAMGVRRDPKVGAQQALEERKRQEAEDKEGA